MPKIKLCIMPACDSPVDPFLVNMCQPCCLAWAKGKTEAWMKRSLRALAIAKERAAAGMKVSA